MHLPRIRGSDPWSKKGSDPWAAAVEPESFEVVERFEDSDGNELFRICTENIKPGTPGYAMLSPTDLLSFAAIFRAAKPVEPFVALCPSPVPGMPAGRCDSLLVKSSVTGRLKQLPVYMFQLGAETAKLRRTEVYTVQEVTTVALALHAFKSRMSQDEWSSLLAAPAKFLKKLVPDVADHWFSRAALTKAQKGGDTLMVCFRVLKDQLNTALAASGKVGVSISFFRSNQDLATEAEAAQFDRIPLDSHKSFDTFASLASRLPVAMCSRDKTWLMVRKTSYKECLSALEKSFLPHNVREFPAAATKILKGLPSVANEQTVVDLARSKGWQVSVETTWTYRDSNVRRRAFRVSFDVVPDTASIWTSQGCVILEDVISKRQLQQQKVEGRSERE